VGKASSAKKIARMAEKGKGKKVRFQGGTVFPLTILVVAVLGLSLIVYSRVSTKALAVPPQASNSDHWHVAYGVFICDDWLPNLAGNKEGDGGTPDPEYLASGVHSHDDGVIHYHPFTAAASGRNAKLKRFLDVYDIELSNDKLTFPDDQNAGQVYEEGVTTCTDADGNEVDGELRLAVWDDAKNPDDVRVLTSNMDDARIDRNGMAMAIYFAPADTDIVPPPAAAQLDVLGAVDSGATTPTTIADGSSTTVADGSSTTLATGSTVSTNASSTTVGEPSATTASSAATTTSSG
jgi:hypothetical protein